MKRKYILFVCILCLLQACTSPRYIPPLTASELPESFKGELVKATGNWTEIREPQALDADSWWEVFGDKKLNVLLEELNRSNQQVAVAAANYRKIHGEKAGTVADFLPNIDGQAAFSRRRTGELPIQQNYSLTGNMSWEVNLARQMARFSSASYTEQMSLAEYVAIKLSLQAELVQAYVNIRVLDEQIVFFGETLDSYRLSLELVKGQLKEGLVSALDFAQAENQLALAEADLAALHGRRAVLENSIAVLVGKVASSFSLAPEPFALKLPLVPQSIPSDLLQNRPDVIADEMRVAAANEAIGIARSSWLPLFSFQANKGLQYEHLASSPLTVWSLGPSLALNFFQGGRAIANVKTAWADYEKEVAGYKQTVLQAIEEVENSLARIDSIQKETEAQERAVRASQEMLVLALSQYKGGLTNYLQVLNAQTRLLDSKRKLISLKGDYLSAHLALIKALGGGWSKKALSSLPKNNLLQEGTVEHRW